MVGLDEAPGVFSRRMYLTPFSGAAGQTVEELRFYRLNPRYAKCYHTEVGVGIVGKLADMTPDKRKGLPWWSMVVIGLVVVGLLFQVPKAFGWTINKFSGALSIKSRRAWAAAGR